MLPAQLTTQRVRGARRATWLHSLRLLRMISMALVAVWLTVGATLVLAEPFDSTRKGQLPAGASAMQVMSAEDFRTRPDRRLAPALDATNLSGSTRRFENDPEESRLYSSITKLTPWKPEWSNEMGETCLQSAAKSFSIDPVLLLAIIEQESGFNPMAKNENDNGSLDVGLMQINSQWQDFLARMGIESSHLTDPCINTHVGAWILNMSIQESSDVWEGVGVYNAGTGTSAAIVERRKAYAVAVAKRFKAFNKLLGRDSWGLASLN